MTVVVPIWTFMNYITVPGLYCFSIRRRNSLLSEGKEEAEGFQKTTAEVFTMTVEVKSETAQLDIPREEPLKEVKEMEKVQEVNGDECEAGKTIEKCSSYREESNFLFDLKDHEKKGLSELKSKLEEAILGGNLFKQEDRKKGSKEPPKEGAKEVDEKAEQNDVKDDIKEDHKENKIDINTEGKNTGNVTEADAQEVKMANGNVEVHTGISIWGVPILPSKGHEGTDVVLLKFLRARDFKVNEAFEMLKKALQWRKEFKIDSILDEDFGDDLAAVAYMNGVDRKGHPICYNIFGVLDDEELYKKILGSEEKSEQFLRWRVQLMEKGIQKLDFNAHGVNSLLQINDLKNSPRPSRKAVRLATKQAVALLQDNYPEFVAKNIFVNVPFWYYAFYSLLSPFLTQRTKSKFVVARPDKVTETLLKYIPIQEVPVQYGGFKKDSDFEFSSNDDEPTEIVVKAGSTEIIEIPAPEAGTTFIWDLTVLGWEVNYKEEFVPTDENSYTIIIQKVKKMSRSNESPIRQTFKNHEPGKIVLTIQNSSSKKKKAIYRHKIKKTSYV